MKRDIEIWMYIVMAMVYKVHLQDAHNNTAPLPHNHPYT